MTEFFLILTKKSSILFSLYAFILDIVSLQVQYFKFLNTIGNKPLYPCSGHYEITVALVKRIQYTVETLVSCVCNSTSNAIDPRRYKCFHRRLSCRDNWCK